VPLSIKGLDDSSWCQREQFQLAIAIFDITEGAVSVAVHCQLLQKDHCRSEDTIQTGVGTKRFKSVTLIIHAPWSEKHFQTMARVRST
jgi:hypothetical protein